MGLFSKKGTPSWLDGFMAEYKELLNDSQYPLSHVFKYYKNDGSDYIYKENTDLRNVFLLRNTNRIALVEKDNNGNEIFHAEKECSIYIVSQPKIIKIIHELYVEKFNHLE